MVYSLMGGKQMLSQITVTFERICNFFCFLWLLPQAQEDKEEEEEKKQKSDNNIFADISYFRLLVRWSKLIQQLKKY